MTEVPPQSPARPPVSLRPATPDDLDSLVALEARVHLAPWNRAAFEGEAEKPYSTTWVLTDDETDSELYGYCVFWVLGGAVEILNLAVDLPHQGQGYAKFIMQKVIQYGLSQGAERLILDVRKSNLPAVALYQRAGLVISQYRKAFYSNGEDAYHMVLNLEGASLDF